MKIAFINDTHMGVRGDREIFLELQRKFFVDFFFPYLKKNNISNILHLGDLFDRRKYINFKTFKRTEEMLFDPAYEQSIQIDAFPGNHDIYWKNSNMINSMNLIASKYDNVNVYDKNPVVKEYDGVGIALVPWICAENYENTIRFLKTTEAKFVAGHFEIKGFDFLPGVQNHEGLSTKIFNRFEQVWSGHFHHKSKKGNIQYLGTQYELSWSDYGYKKGFHVFDTETKELEFIENPITIYSKIFYNDEKSDYIDYKYEDFKDRFVKVLVVKKTNHLLFDNFINKLQSAGVIDISIIEDHQTLDDDIEIELNKSEDTMSLLDNYVDEMDISCDKQKIKNIIRELHTEAISMS